MPYEPSIDQGPPVDVLRTDQTGQVDLEQIEYNLSLTPAQRLEHNDRAAEFVAAAREAGRKFYGEVS
jgi:hypothetical protein